MATRTYPSDTKDPHHVSMSLLKQSAAQLFSMVEAVVALGGTLLVIALAIPWLSEPLNRLGFGNGITASQLVITLVLVSLFFQVRRLVDHVTVDPPVAHFADPLDVYPDLQKRMAAVRRDEDKVLDVIGMTLYTAWPSLKFFLTRPGSVSGWTVRFAAYVGVAGDAAGWVPASWPKESENNLANIVSSQSLPSIVNGRIKLETYAYDFAPVLHGFRLRNGDLYYSLLLWDESGKVTLEGYSYEFVSAADHSASAEAARNIFDSWFRRASDVPWLTPEMRDAKPHPEA